MLLAVLINFAVFGLTAGIYVSCFRDRDGNWSLNNGLQALRFFTLLSNLFCGLVSLLMGLALLRSVPRWLWLLKYLATHTVTVTLLTVLVFLGPSLGYSEMFRGRDLYLHLIGPVLAIVSFCFLERIYPLSFSASLIGLIPVALYGLFYLYKVVLCPEGQRWEDFYGFNKTGKWPISFAAMLLGAFVICLLLRLLTRI